MADEILGDRHRATEEEFFRLREMALLEGPRAKELGRATRAALAVASHIQDETLLDQLLALGITAETLVTLSLVPLIEVAWADGRLEEREKEAILAAARESGMDAEGPAFRQLESRLASRPPAVFREAWRHHIGRLCAGLSLAERDTLRAEMLRQARRVAEAASGHLGMGWKVSGDEETLLRELAQAFPN